MLNYHMKYPAESVWAKVYSVVLEVTVENIKQKSARGQKV